MCDDDATADDDYDIPTVLSPAEVSDREAFVLKFSGVIRRDTSSKASLRKKRKIRKPLTGSGNTVVMEPPIPELKQAEMEHIFLNRNMEHEERYTLMVECDDPPKSPSQSGVIKNARVNVWFHESAFGVDLMKAVLHAYLIARVLDGSVTIVSGQGKPSNSPPSTKVDVRKHHRRDAVSVLRDMVNKHKDAVGRSNMNNRVMPDPDDDDETTVRQPEIVLDSYDKPPEPGSGVGSGVGAGDGANKTEPKIPDDTKPFDDVIKITHKFLDRVFVDFIEQLRSHGWNVRYDFLSFGADNRITIVK